MKVVGVLALVVVAGIAVIQFRARSAPPPEPSFVTRLLVATSTERDDLLLQMLRRAEKPCREVTSSSDDGREEGRRWFRAGCFDGERYQIGANLDDEGVIVLTCSSSGACR